LPVPRPAQIDRASRRLTRQVQDVFVLLATMVFGQ
jgi:hypothetical protein